MMTIGICFQFNLFIYISGNQVIYVLHEIYFTNLYRFPETENLLYIDQYTCQYHYVHFRYNLYKLVKDISGNMYFTRFFQLSETGNIHIT